MVEEIYKMKNELLKQAKKELEERGPERIDVNRMGEMIDMVKDLAEAEKSCWEADYYRKVSKSMEGSSGYSTTGNPASGGGNIRSGYDSMGYGSMGSMRQGYGSGDMVEEFAEKYAQLRPDERMAMKNQLLTKLGSM